MLSCKQVSRKVSESLDRKLTWREQLEVKLHLMICTPCRRMVRQFELLRSASRHEQSLEDASDQERITLSPAARQRILKTLQEAQREPRKHG